MVVLEVRANVCISGCRVLSRRLYHCLVILNYFLLDQNTRVRHVEKRVAGFDNEAPYLPASIH